jgi:hypothetical protein
MKVVKKLALGNAHQEFVFIPPQDGFADFRSIINKFFLAVYRKIKKAAQILPRSHSLKFQIRIQARLERYSFELQRHIFTEPWFLSEIFSTLGRDKLKAKLNEAFAKCELHYDHFVRVGSGWTLKEVLSIHLCLMRYKLFSGACALRTLPHALMNKRGIIFVQNNEENNCFLLAVISVLLNVKKNKGRLTKKYLNFLAQFPQKFKKYPFTEREILRFEKETHVSINVYGFEKVIFPHYISEHSQNADFHVNLLLHENHYYGITNLGSLLSVKRNTRKTFVCQYCLSYFVSFSKFSTHVDLCSEKLQLLSFPSEDDKILKFSDFSTLIPAPFVIYADFESSIQEEKVIEDKTKKTISRRKHLPIAVASNTICWGDPFHSSPFPFYYVGANCMDKFFEHISYECERFRKILSRPRDMVMNDVDWENFHQAQQCFMCHISFDLPQVVKVRDHDHISGRYRFALCSRCNLTYAQQSRKIHIFFHGLSNYDHHFIISNLHKIENHNTRVIPKTGQKYLSFSIGDVNFKDSCQFLSGSLASHVRNLRDKGEEFFFNVNHHFQDEYQRKLFYRKGVFPYNYISSLAKLQETSLPSRENFYNDLTQSHILEEEYVFACDVWEILGCQTLQDYLIFYLLADVLLLSDVFENFRQTTLDNYELDPAHFVSNAQLTLSAFLRYSRAELELFTDVNKYFFVKKGVRGGVSMSVLRYAQANNPYLRNYETLKNDSYIMYFDCNNLYGQAMLQHLPVGNFEWEENVTVDEILSCPADGDVGYIVQCDLKYPQSLHDAHSDFPLAPHHAGIPKSCLSPFAKAILAKNKGHIPPRATGAKLLCTLHDKHDYVLHYRTLQCYVSLGLQVVKIKKVLSFSQAPVLKSYIDLNTERRANATNEFDVNYFKLMSNSLFGKTMEKAENRIKVDLVSDIKKYEKKAASVALQTVNRINKNLVAIQSKYTRLFIKKPVYLGMCILDISKVFMYNFHYKVMRNFYPSYKISLLYTDTDSFVYHIQTKDVYRDLEKIQQYFDFSNYPKSHFLFSDKNKKIPGFFKDESGGEFITEFVSLKSKMYAFVRQEREKLREHKSAKGVQNCVIEHNLKFDHYLACLRLNIVYEHEFSNIRSVDHQVFTSKQKKISLSCFDDKRYLTSNTTSLPYGHVNIS